MSQLFNLKSERKVKKHHTFEIVSIRSAPARVMTQNPGYGETTR